MEQDLVAQSVGAAYVSHGPAVRGYLVKAIHDPAAAEDLLQDVFVRLVRQSTSRADPDNLRPWLFTVARNLVASRGRRLAVSRRWLDRQRPYADTSNSVDSTESLVVGHERASTLYRAIAELPARSRVALLLAAQGFSGDEMAAALGATDACARTILCRARSRVRSRVDELEREPRRTDFELASRPTLSRTRDASPR